MVIGGHSVFIGSKWRRNWKNWGTEEKIDTLKELGYVLGRGLTLSTPSGEGAEAERAEMGVERKDFFDVKFPAESHRNAIDEGDVLGELGLKKEVQSCLKVIGIYR